MLAPKPDDMSLMAGHTQEKESPDSCTLSYDFHTHVSARVRIHTERERESRGAANKDKKSSVVFFFHVKESLKSYPQQLTEIVSLI